MSFLTAYWKDLIFINYKIEKKILQNYLPAHLELDDFDNEHFVSVVAFKFFDTRIKGFHIPFHVNFNEINLRFYVKRKVEDLQRRGVVFIKEIVPKSAITLLANLLYKENYVTRSIVYNDEINDRYSSFKYSWNELGRKQSMQVRSNNHSIDAPAGSKIRFITEHYFGYSRFSESNTIEYRVEHPQWKILEATDFRVDIDYEHVYGPDWRILNDSEPDSVFIASGSPVVINPKKILKSRTFITK
jgi:uncharacterized protein YqjF (DUF2071 family)